MGGCEGIDVIKQPNRGCRIFRVSCDVVHHSALFSKVQPIRPHIFVVQDGSANTSVTPEINHFLIGKRSETRRVDISDTKMGRVNPMSFMANACIRGIDVCPSTSRSAEKNRGSIPHGHRFSGTTDHWMSIDAIRNRPEENELGRGQITVSLPLHENVIFVQLTVRYGRTVWIEAGLGLP